jgi:hypothetical protein
MRRKKLASGKMNSLPDENRRQSFFLFRFAARKRKKSSLPSSSVFSVPLWFIFFFIQYLNSGWSVMQKRVPRSRESICSTSSGVSVKSRARFSKRWARERAFGMMGIPF